MDKVSAVSFLKNACNGGVTMTDLKKLNDKLTPDLLEKVVGGNGYPQGELHLAQPKVTAGTYLALRCQPSWNDSNEIAQIYSGTRFYVDITRVAYGSGYNYYWADYNGTWGWVNQSFLTLLD